MSVLAMEFPGYGFFTHKIKDGKLSTSKLSCSAAKIKENAEILY
jgi:hypothetical protein